MAKRLVYEIVPANSTALVIAGWLAFVVGAVIGCPIWLKIILLSAARVLPLSHFGGTLHSRTSTASLGDIGVEGDGESMILCSR